MNGDKPEGGRWNFDAENRKPAQPDLFRLIIRRSPDRITSEGLIWSTTIC